jgi:hypothetical protein
MLTTDNWWGRGGDGGNKAIPSPMLGLDDSLCTAIVAHGFTRFDEAINQRRLADHLAGPELRSEFVFRHHPIVMLNKINENIKDLGLHRYDLAVAAELIKVVVKFVGMKTVDHRFDSGSLRHCQRQA